MFFFRSKKPKFDDSLERLLENARHLARSYAHDYIGVEHAFLCLRNLPASEDAAKVLKSLPVEMTAFWDDLERSARIVTNRPAPAVLPFTPRLNKVLEWARYWAIYGKEKEVTLFHFLGGVAKEGNSLVAHVFRGHFKNKNPEYTNIDAMAAQIVTMMQFPYAVRYQREGEPNALIQPTPDSVTFSSSAGEQVPPV